jgi:hypothetical protein
MMTAICDADWDMSDRAASAPLPKPRVSAVSPPLTEEHCDWSQPELSCDDLDFGAAAAATARTTTASVQVGGGAVAAAVPEGYVVEHAAMSRLLRDKNDEIRRLEHLVRALRRQLPAATAAPARGRATMPLDDVWPGHQCVDVMWSQPAAGTELR